MSSRDVVLEEAEANLESAKELATYARQLVTVCNDVCVKVKMGEAAPASHVAARLIAAAHLRGRIAALLKNMEPSMSDVMMEPDNHTAVYTCIVTQEQSIISRKETIQ